MEKIISVIFKVESEGYQAITELKKTPVTEDYTVSQAALVKKENGQIKILDFFDTGIETVNDTAIGGLIGGFLGILGGPIGMLLGGSLGALTGSVLDTGDAFHNASLIEMVTQQLVDGEVVLIALEQEAEECAVQKMLSRFDVSIVEEDAAEVAEEIERAATAQKEMERQAREQLRDAKKAEFRQKVEEHRAKLSDEFEAFKAKFKKE
jgi:uncharacterized membrane protein